MTDGKKAKQARDKMPVRLARIELEEPWEGWWFEARVNAPLEVLDWLSVGTFGQIIKALRQIVTDWNFLDEEGKPLLADVHGDGGEVVGTRPRVERIPRDLLDHMAARFYVKVRELPPE